MAPTNLTHLQLEESSLFLHLFSDFCPADFRPNHPMLSRMLLLFLFYLGAGKSDSVAEGVKEQSIDP